MISSYISILLLVMLYTRVFVDAQSVTCTRYGIEKSIEGIQGSNVFKEYKNQCGDETSIVDARR